MTAASLLLDTHVFLWWRTNDSKVGDAARAAIAAAPVVFVSVASAWEAALKVALGRLRLPDSFENGVAASGFDKLAISFAHAEACARLPHHHRDPFDRMLIAQARAEDLLLVTHDAQLTAYEVDVLVT